MRLTTGDSPHGHFEYRPHFDLVSETPAGPAGIRERHSVTQAQNKGQTPVGPPSAGEMYRNRQTNQHNSVTNLIHIHYHNLFIVS
jgi:hypothetical protein